MVDGGVIAFRVTDGAERWVRDGGTGIRSWRIVRTDDGPHAAPPCAGWSCDRTSPPFRTMRIEAGTPDHYFEQLGPTRRSSVLVLRDLIRTIWPGAREALVNDMPTYFVDGLAVFALADQKNYLCLYVLPYDLLDAFRNELKAFNHGRSCIRFRRVDDDAIDLCERVIRYVGAMHHQSRVLQAARG